MGLQRNTKEVHFLERERSQGHRTKQILRFDVTNLSVSYEVLLHYFPNSSICRKMVHKFYLKKKISCTDQGKKIL